jgi:hypothetical protein
MRTLHGLGVGHIGTYSIEMSNSSNFLLGKPLPSTMTKGPTATAQLLSGQSKTKSLPCLSSDLDGEDDLELSLEDKENEQLLSDSASELDTSGYSDQEH